MIFTCIWLAYGDNDDDTDNDNDFDELHHDERLLHLHVVGWSRSEPDPAFRHIVVLPHKISESSWSSRRPHLTPFYYLHHQGFLIFLHLGAPHHQAVLIFLHLWFPDLAPRPLVLVGVHHRSEPRLQSAIWFYSSNDYYDDDDDDRDGGVMVVMMITWELSILRYQVISAGGREPQETQPIEYSLQWYWSDIQRIFCTFFSFLMFNLT